MNNWIIDVFGDHETWFDPLPEVTFTLVAGKMLPSWGDFLPERSEVLPPMGDDLPELPNCFCPWAMTFRKLRNCFRPWAMVFRNVRNCFCPGAMSFLNLPSCFCPEATAYFAFVYLVLLKFQRTLRWLQAVMCLQFEAKIMNERVVILTDIR